VWEDAAAFLVDVMLKVWITPYFFLLLVDYAEVFLLEILFVSSSNRHINSELENTRRPGGLPG
jgi:hypothetical protein